MAIELGSYPTLRNDANLVSYYKLEGNSNDEKTANNGTDTSITYGTSYGKFNQGALFNGTSSKITLGTNASLRNSTFTYMAWINPTAGAGNGGLFSGNDSGGPAFRINNTTGIMNLSEANVNDIGSSTSAVSTGVMSLVSVSYNGSTGAYVFTINGVAAGSGTVLRTFTWGTFYLGYCNGASFFKGSMDDPSIFSRVVSTSEILAYYNAIASSSAFFNFF